MKMIQSLVKGLKILESLADSPDGAKVVDISKEFNMPSSNTSIFLQTLAQLGYVIKNPLDKRYYLSEKILHLAERLRHTKYTELIHHAQQPMEKLHQTFNENVILGVLNNYRLKLIDRLQSTHNIQIVHSDELTFTAHATAGGKAILAYFSESQLESYFKKTEMTRFTERTLTNKEEIREQLQQIRQQHYAVNISEYQEEVMAIASPIFDHQGVVGSIIVQFPTFRHTEQHLEKYAPEIVQAARTISSSISA
jgi:DNA-binding IclR family transcriptional regulator